MAVAEKKLLVNYYSRPVPSHHFRRLQQQTTLNSKSVLCISVATVTTLNSSYSMYFVLGNVVHMDGTLGVLKYRVVFDKVSRFKLSLASPILTVRAVLINKLAIKIKARTNTEIPHATYLAVFKLWPCLKARVTYLARGCIV